MHWALKLSSFLGLAAVSYAVDFEKSYFGKIVLYTAFLGVSGVYGSMLLSKYFMSVESLLLGKPALAAGAILSICSTIALLAPPEEYLKWESPKKSIWMAGLAIMVLRKAFDLESTNMSRLYLFIGLLWGTSSVFIKM